MLTYKATFSNIDNIYKDCMFVTGVMSYTALKCF